MMETVTVTDKKNKVLNTDFRGFTVVSNLIKGMTCFVFTIVLLSMGGSALYDISQNNTTGDYALGGVIYGLTSNLTLIGYVALFFAFVATLTLVMFKQKSLPIPPVEDLTVDLLLVTLTGLCVAVIATVGGGMMTVVLAALCLTYLPATRLYRHLAWWYREFPKKEVKKVA